MPAAQEPTTAAINGEKVEMHGEYDLPERSSKGEYLSGTKDIWYLVRYLAVGRSKE